MDYCNLRFILVEIFIQDLESSPDIRGNPFCEAREKRLQQ